MRKISIKSYYIRRSSIINIVVIITIVVIAWVASFIGYFDLIFLFWKNGPLFGILKTQTLNRQSFYWNAINLIGFRSARKYKILRQRKKKV